MTAQEDGEGNDWDLDYATDETTVTDPEGGETVSSFDSLGRLSSEEDHLGRTTTYAYDADGNLDELGLPGGADWTFDYDARGNLTSAIDPEGGERAYTYDGAQPHDLSFTDERNEIWYYDLGLGQRPDRDRRTRGQARTTTSPTTRPGQPVTITDPLNHTTHPTPTTPTASLPPVTERLRASQTTLWLRRLQPADLGRRVRGLAAETYTRNKLGDLLTQARRPEGHTTTFGYDENGALTVDHRPSAERLGRSSATPWSSPMTYTDPLLHETTIAYDGNLNPISITDRNGHTTTYAYDLANQLTDVDAPATGAWQFGYDARGNRDEVIDPRANTTTYDYDLNDRLVAANEPETTDHGRTTTTRPAT